MNMKRFFLLFALQFAFVTPTLADEGMWLPSQIESRVKDMRKKGFRLRAADLYSAEKPSLNDAIVLFGSGCTGAIVSAEGLLLTNHHCGYGQIQKHSSVANDYLTNGFWAMNRDGELPNPGLQVSIMIRMENVTGAVAEGRSDEILEQARQGGRYRAEIKPLYYGNEHWLWVYEVFTDVRLVAAPPSSIGKFGGDTDNWIWPRHTGDFSVFRIYASADGSNRPAAYSSDNVPYRPSKFFTVSTEGVKEGDFTFVYGYPGTTQEYVTSDAVNYIVERSNPMKIALRTLRLDIIKEASAADPATRIEYAARQANIANAWKKWQGESWGLKRRGTVERKRAEEAEFRSWAASKPGYAHLLDSLAAGYDRWDDVLYLNELFNETFRVMEFGDTEVNRLTNAALLKGFSDWWPESDASSSTSFLADSPGVYENLAANPEVLEELRNDVWEALNIPRVASFSAIEDIARHYTPYMRALREFDADRGFYPDANLTLRIAYGTVAGYRYEDAVRHEPVTTLDGVMAKDNPEVYDYDIPSRLRELYAAKDYGRWATTIYGRRTVPVCFIASNHTSGGNSGSPILNARGELLGLNFDRTWLGTMSDIEFDAGICRNISVDIRYVMFVIEKVGGADWIVREMTFSK